MHVIWQFLALIARAVCKTQLRDNQLKLLTSAIVGVAKDECDKVYTVVIFLFYINKKIQRITLWS